MGVENKPGIRVTCDICKAEAYSGENFIKMIDAYGDEIIICVSCLKNLLDEK